MFRLIILSFVLSSCGKNDSPVEKILGFFLFVGLIVYVVGFLSTKPTNPKYWSGSDSKNADLNGIGNVFIVIVLAVLVLIIYGLIKLLNGLF